ncbi:hypothetical protein PFISCL1PPCAC_18909, partial [Pristionchus fissidentatus]
HSSCLGSAERLPSLSLPHLPSFTSPLPVKFFHVSRLPSTHGIATVLQKLRFFLFFLHLSFIQLPHRVLISSGPGPLIHSHCCTNVRD